MLFRFLRPAAALMAAATITACSAFGSKAAPEPEFATLTSETPFEVRAYPELVVAKTAMDDGTRGGFGRLFDYISGANGGERKIAMTAPVLESGKGQEIAMTAPVITSRKGTEIAMTAPVLRENGKAGGSEMAFILPEGFTADTAPVPTDPAVRLDVIPPRRVAVISFSGVADEGDVVANRKKLEAWMSANGLIAAGPPELAQYNPPWTIPAMRRNEVLIPVEGQ